MAKYLLAIFLFVSVNVYSEKHKQIEYLLINDPIDVVIVSHPKDKKTLDLCIDGIRKNCQDVRRVIVVSATKLTDNAEWFDEANFPFSKPDIELQVGRGKRAVGKKFFESDHPIGWYYQQLLKLYSAFVIPDISTNILVVDADTVFLNPVKFLNKSCGGLFCTSTMSAKKRYLKHAKRLLPNYKRIYPQYYSVCHHMLLQKSILENLFKQVEKKHQHLFWIAFCRCVDLKEGGASEYEIYYNFALSTTQQVGLRHLKWENSPNLATMKSYQVHGYHFVSFHTYMRKKQELRPWTKQHKKDPKEDPKKRPKKKRPV